MKKRILSLLLVLSMMASLVPTTTFAADGNQSSEAALQEIDTQTYSNLGLALNDNDVLDAPLGERANLGVQKELYYAWQAHGIQTDSTSSEFGAGDTHGYILRNDALGISGNDNWKNAEQSGFLAFLDLSDDWGIHTQGDKAKEVLAGGNWLYRVSTEEQHGYYINEKRYIRYATSTEFDGGRGKEDFIAELAYYIENDKLKLSLFIYDVNVNELRVNQVTINERVLKSKIDLPEVLDISKYDVENKQNRMFNGRLYGDELYSALFEINAGDYDGDGVDEIALTYPRADGGKDEVLVYSYSKDNATLEQTQTLNVDATFTNTSDHKAISLTSGVFKRNGRDQLFVSVSDSSDSSLYVFDNYNRDYYVSSLGMKYSAVALGNLKNAVDSGEITAVIGGFSSANGTAYRFLNYDLDYKLGSVNTQAPNSTASYRFSVGNDWIYHAPIAVACAALNGTYAMDKSRDSVLLMDRVYVLESNGKLTPLDDDKNNGYVDFNTIGDTWIDKVVVANLTGDAKGSEQYGIVVANAEADMTGIPSEINQQKNFVEKRRSLYFYTYSWHYASSDALPDGMREEYSNIYYTSADAIRFLSYASDPLSSEFPAFQLTDSYVSVCTPDADDDATQLKLVDTYKVYTNPEVIAILQSSPYFEDVAQSFPDQYPNQAATEWGQSNSTGSSSSTTGNWHAGVYIASEVQLFGGADVEVETIYTGSTETVESTIITEEFAYQTTAGEDSVLVIAVPYMFFVYEITKNGVTSEMTSYYPMSVIKSQITIDQYDEVANATDGLEPIRGNIITSDPGDPYSYMQWPSGSINIHTPSTVSSVVSSSSNFNTTISGTVESEKEESVTHGFEINSKVGSGGALFGNKVMAGVTGGGGAEWTKAEFSAVGTTFSGTVDNLPEEAVAYGFDWQISRRFAILNGDPVQLVSYKTANVYRGVGVPANLAVDEVTQDSITLSWDSVNEALQYVIYQRDSTGLEAPIAQVAKTSGERQSAKLTGLYNNRSYTYFVTSISGQGRGESLKSGVVSGTTLPAGGTLRITSQPQDASTYPNGTVSFSARGSYMDETGAKALSYQWYQRANSDASWRTIGTGSTLQRLATEAMNGYEYYCRIYLSNDSSFAINTQTVTLSVGKQESATSLNGSPTAEKIIMTNGTMQEQDQPFIMYAAGGIVYIKKSVSGINIWQGSDGNYYPYTDDTTVPTQASKITPLMNKLYINGQIVTDWSANSSKTIGDKTITKTSNGLYYYTIKGQTDADKITVSIPAYPVYKSKNVEFATAQLATVTRNVISAVAGNGGETVTLSANVEADGAEHYGKASFTISAPGVATTNVTADVNSGGQATANWTPTTPGLYTVVARYEGDSRYLASNSAPVTYLVASKDNGSKILMLSTGRLAITYGDSLNLSPEMITTNAGSTTREAVNEAATYSMTINGVESSTAGVISNNTFTPKVSGTYVITAAYSEDGTRYTASATISVSKHILSIAANNLVSMLNNTQRPEPTATITGLVLGDSVVQGKEYTLTTLGYDASKTGDYPIRLTLVEDNVAHLREKYIILQSDGVYSLTGSAHQINAIAENNGGVEIVYEIENNDIVSRFVAKSGDPIPEGAKVILTAVPDSGYQVENWIVNGEYWLDGSDYNTSTTYVIPNMTKAENISIRFTPKYSKLNFSVEENGTISAQYMNGSIVGGSFASGSNVSVLQSIRMLATPKDGYAIESWKVKGEIVKAADGISNFTGTTYTLSEISEDTTVVVSMVEEKTHSITVKFVDTDGAEVAGDTTVSVGGKPLSLSGSTYSYEAKTSENLALNITIPDGLIISNWNVGEGQISGSMSLDKKTMTLYNVNADADFTVVCAVPNSYTVDFSANDNDGGDVSAVKIGSAGTALVSGDKQLQGSAILFTADVADGWMLDHWTFNGATLYTVGNTFQIINLASDVTIQAVFTQLPTITVTGTNQTNDAPSYVGFGKTVDIIITPSAGYKITNVMVNGEQVSTSNVIESDAKSITLTNVQENQVIEVTTEKLEQYTISYSVVGENGGLDASATRYGSNIDNLNNEDGKFTTYEGAIVSLTATPEQGYMVQLWTIDSVEQPHRSATMKLFGDSLKDSDVTVAFQDATQTEISFRAAVNDVTITDETIAGSVSATAAGTDFISGAIAREGLQITLTAEAEPGWEVEKWTVGGLDVADNSTDTLVYTVSDDNMGEIEIVATFIQKHYTVSFGNDITVSDVTDEDNPINVINNSQVRGGRMIKFVATPSQGYDFENWTVNGQEYSENTLVISEDVTVIANYTPKTLTASFSADANGLVSMGDETNSPTTFTAGTDVKFTLTANEGYIVDTWTVTDGTANIPFEQSGNTITVKNAVVDLTVSVTTKLDATNMIPITYQVQGGNGILEVSGLTDGKVAAGSKLVFKATPDTYFMLNDWSVTGDEAVAYTVDTDSQTQISTLTVLEVKGALNVTVSFRSAQEYTVLAGVMGSIGGSVSYDGNDYTTAISIITPRHLVTPNTEITFTANPDNGEMVSAWYVNGVVQEGELGNTFTTTASASVNEVEVEFAHHEAYRITPVVQNGNVVIESKNPNDHMDDDANAVHKNGEIVFKLTPSDGYAFKSASLVNSSAGELTQEIQPDGTVIITVKNVTAASTLSIICETSYVVTFSTSKTGGKITATANGIAITSGDKVAGGSEVIFTAKPDSGYVIDAWVGAGTESVDKTTKTIESLSGDTIVQLCSEALAAVQAAVVVVQAAVVVVQAAAVAAAEV